MVGITRSKVIFWVWIFSQREDWNEDDSHPNFVEHVNSSTFVFYSSSFESALNYVCILHGTIVFDIFFINPNTKPLFIFLPFPHGIHRRIQAWGHTPPTPSSQDARRRPCTAELLQGAKRTSVRIIRTRSAPWTTWRSFWKSRGSWRRRGWGSLGWEVTLLDVSPRAYFCLAKAWGLDFLLSISQYCWITFFGRNTSLGPPSTFHSCNRQNEHMAKLTNLSGEFLQMRPIDGYSYIV